MNTTKNKSNVAKFHKRTAISLAIATSLTLSVNAAAADSKTKNEKDNLEVITVTGKYNASLTKALDLKRESTGVRDSIVAEDIGKMPDLNLAESLQRITGVAISRNDGEGQQVSIRGLAPEFTQTTLNGMVVSSSSIGGTDANNKGREFDFDLLPSELFSRIDVDKTSRADLSEGGIGGTIGLSLPRPFDNDGFHLSGSLQGNYSEYPDTTDPRGHFLVSNTWNDNFGITVQTAYSERATQVEGASSVDWTRNSSPSNGYDLQFPNGTPAGFTETELRDAYVPRLGRTDVQKAESTRLGVTASIQWMPTDTLGLTLDAVHASLEKDYVRHNFDVALRGQTLDLNPDGDFEIDSHGNMVKGALSGVSRRSENRKVNSETTLDQLVLNADWDVTDKFTVHALLGTSSSVYDNPYTISNMFQIQGSDIFFDYTDKLPSITTTTDVTNPDNYVVAAPRVRSEKIEDDSDSFQLDFAYDTEAGIKISGGIFANSYSKERQELDNSGFASDAEANIPVSAFSTQISGYDNMDAPAGFPSGYLISDFDKVDDLFGLIAKAPHGNVLSGSTGTVEEDSSGFYVSADVFFDIGDMASSLNIGGRYIKTEQTSEGAVNDADGNPVAVVFNNNYKNFLPSINFNTEITEDFQVKVSASQAMTRSSLGSLLPAISVRGNSREASQGNPNLEPYIADQFDVAAEWYFAEHSLLSATFFYKDIKAFIVNESTTVPYSALGLPLDILQDSALATGIDMNTPFTLQGPVNGNGATIRGLELSYQQPLDFVVEGLGILTNFTYADSETEFASGVPGAGEASFFANGENSIKGTIPGLSKSSYNIAAYYENDTLGGRLTYNWRDEYIRSSSVRDRTGLLQTTDAAGYLDASAYYNVNDMVTVTFEAINLLNTEEYTFNGDASRLYYHAETGRQFSLGVRVAM